MWESHKKHCIYAIIRQLAKKRERKKNFPRLYFHREIYKTFFFPRSHIATKCNKFFPTTMRNINEKISFSFHPRMYWTIFDCLGRFLFFFFFLPRFYFFFFVHNVNNLEHFSREKMPRFGYFFLFFLLYYFIDCGRDWKDTQR